MKTLVLLISLMTFSFSKIDLDKFSGKWYEIARTYNSFQKECITSFVIYNLIEGKVKNRCLDTNNNLIKYNGSIKVLDENKIKFTYFFFFSQIHTVVYNDYQTAILMSLDKKNIWLMSRTKIMKEKKKEKMLSIISKFIDIESLILSKN